MVGKVRSVHLSKNINKSHHYELIMKSQVAWVKKKMKGGPRVDSWKLASATEIGRNVLDLCWQKTWPLFDMFTWCKTHPTQHTYINTITHRDNSDTNTCTEGPWNVKSC